jgi:protein-disulfide isomerase
MLAAGCGRGGGEGTDGQTNPASAKVASAAVARVPIDGAPVKGDRAALVTLVAFSDYECPFCIRGNATVEQLQKIYGDKLRIVARQNPLPFHARAEPAARAALAAWEQGKFWEMHERLFANSRSLDDESLDRIAAEIGLDVARFRAKRTSEDTRAAIERDRALAAGIGARGTPAYFINGRRLEGARPLDDFKAVIGEEIRKAEALIASGVPPKDVYESVMKAAPPSTALNGTAPKAAQMPPGANECEGGSSSGGCDCAGGSAVEQGAGAVEDVSAGAAPLKGPASAKVTVIVFSDFECPFCKKAEDTLRELEQQYPGQLRIAFRNQPLPFHQHARLAAKAALAAGEQGKFWEYHDALFTHQDALDRAALERYAGDLGLDLRRFRSALDEDTLDAAIGADTDEASRLRVQGTPTFFVNGRRIMGAQPLRVFREAIDLAIAAP